MTSEEFTIQLIKNFFNQADVKYKDTGRLDSWLFQYFNFRLKFISPQKREALLSHNLKDNMSCHPAVLSFLEILNKTSQGEDLNIYQGLGIKDACRHDDLYNDWGIHHLHLNSDMDRHPFSPYFVKRSDYLLFVKFTDSAAYFIDVFEHREKPLWGKRQLIETIQNNWEYLIKNKEVRGLVHPDFEDEEIEIMRRKGYLFGVNVGGKGYLLLGAGSATAGNNMDANRLAGRVCRWIYENSGFFESDRMSFKKGLLTEMYLS